MIMMGENEDKGQFIITRAVSMRDEETRYTNVNLSPINYGNSAIIVNCTNPNRLVVEYANQNALDMLGYDQPSLINTELSHIIPDFFKIFHHTNFKNVIKELTEKIALPNPFYVADSRGNLISVNIEINVDTINGEIYMLMVFNHSTTFDKSAIIKDGYIVGVTPKFPQSFQIEQNCVGKSLETILPGIDCRLEKCICLLMTGICIFFTDIKVHDETFVILAIIESKEDLKN